MWRSGDLRPEILIPSGSAFTGNVNDSFVMQFIAAPMTPLGPRSDGQKGEGRPLSLKERRKRTLFQTKHKRHREMLNVVAAKRWEFMIGFSSSSLAVVPAWKEGRGAKFAWSDRLQMSVLDSLKMCPPPLLHPLEKSPIQYAVLYSFYHKSAGGPDVF